VRRFAAGAEEERRRRRGGGGGEICDDGWVGDVGGVVSMSERSTKRLDMSRVRKLD
jgi:hypothetical protein